MKLTTLELIAVILVIIGGLNWGLVSLGYNLVEGIFGSVGWLVTTIYALVGLSAVYMIVFVGKLEKR